MPEKNNSEKIPPNETCHSFISGCGLTLPQRIVSNQHFAQYLDTSDEWIRERTGIEERRWAEPGVKASELAEPAARQAIAAAGLTPSDIGGIVLATVTPDCPFPSTACYLQRRLGISGGFAFDVNAVCSGFVYALVNADALLRAGHAKHVLVVGVDLYSRIIDPQDRRTCVLFGDGAGAVVLSVDAQNTQARGILASEIGADGQYAEILFVPEAKSTESGLAKSFVQMEGREVFKQAVRKLSEISSGILARTGLKASDVSYVISHQANKRILSAMADHLGISGEKVLTNVERYGNTSAASIPILLAETVAAGKIKSGDLLLLSAFGGGVTWGTILLRW